MEENHQTIALSIHMNKNTVYQRMLGDMFAFVYLWMFLDEGCVTLPMQNSSTVTVQLE